MKAMKKIIASLLAVATVVAGLNVGTVKVDAASKTKTITTTQECSIWTRPNTTEKYRQKKIPAGHQVTVYTDVIKSEKNDGKTFYKTKKGAYILCRCCDGNEVGAAFSDPAWARMKKVMAPGGYFTVYDNVLDMVLDENESTDLWSEAVKWMKSTGVYEACTSAKFSLVYDNSDAGYGEDWQYKAAIPGYTLYIFTYPFKGSAIYLQAPDGHVIDFEFE